MFASLRLTPLLLCLPVVAAANPRPLAYTYPAETLPERGLEIEQFADLTPVPAIGVDGAQTWLDRLILTTEIEYGLTDHLELGLYFELSDNPGNSLPGAAPLAFDGLMERLRWSLADPGTWPVDVALYGEVAEFQSEVELEGKVIIQKRFGPLETVVNLWAERELYFTGAQEWVVHPTAGLSYEVTPSIHVGLEWWMSQELGGPPASQSNGSEGVGATYTFNQSLHQYVGPSIMFQFKHLWWTVAPYVSLDDPERASAVGDLYGRFWLRSVIGIDL